MKLDARVDEIAGLDVDKGWCRGRYLEEIIMRRGIVGCLMVLVVATAAWAEWKVDFKEKYAKEGIDQAVVDAMKEGALPVEIVESGLQLEGLNPQNLVKALYCAGANGQDVTSAAQQYNINEIIIAAGYKKAVEECGDQVADSQAYSPLNQGGRVRFGGEPKPAGSGVFASPSTFQ